ncbi:hypothetical protein [Candidatus Protochlamydia phocaeensis]|uniref:hypothetical protein n=1 Tax=Candidatus Protochlamydia phocaeensis TaxID=1414722 RepID=UPI00083850A0|nr:hypothetical protein [Candidatus Protochlamydia phocaeensis]
MPIFLINVTILKKTIILEEKEKLLVGILFDKNASITEKDDAAMYLEKYDSDYVLNALIKAAQDPTESTTVLETCGESIGSIWVRRNQFDEKSYYSLVKDARDGIYFVVESRKPDWIKQFELK